MVQMAVRNEERPNFVLVFLQIGGIGQNVVYTRRFYFAELKTGVYDYDVVSAFYGQHVFADFFHPAQWNNADIVSDRRDGESPWPLRALGGRRTAKMSAGSRPLVSHPAPAVSAAPSSGLSVRVGAGRNPPAPAVSTGPSRVSARRASAGVVNSAAAPGSVSRASL